MRVNELNCPTRGIPVFGYERTGIPLNHLLFKIKKRIPVIGGNDVTRNQFRTQPAHDTDFPSEFRTMDTGNTVFYNIPSVVTGIAKYGNNYTERQDDHGVTQATHHLGQDVIAANTHSEYLRIRLNACCPTRVVISKSTSSRKIPSSDSNSTLILVGK